MFSIGGDGALHVLDDADANGYIKPPPTSGARRKPRTKASSDNPDRGANGGGAQNNHNHEEIGAVCSNDDDSAAKQGGRRSWRCPVAQEERVRPGDEKYGAGGAMPTGEGGEVGKGAGAGEAVDSSIPADGLPAGAKKKGDGGRSVLLRQVVLSSNDDDHDGGTTNNKGDINDEDDRKRGCGRGRRSYDPTGRSDRYGPGSPPSRRPRATMGASHPELDTLDDDGLSAEPVRDSPGSTSSGKSR